METTLQGLYVTVVGMSLLFLALGVLMLCINLLGRAFPVRAEVEPAPEPVAVPIPTEGMRIAAIAVALALATSPLSPSMIEEGPGVGSWVILGRQAQMGSRQRR